MIVYYVYCILALGMVVGQTEAKNNTGITLGDWKLGRATFFGADGYTIHEGNCGFGDQFENVYPGFHVAAVSDKSGEFSNSCGRCYEVACRNAVFTDGYGEKIDRTQACFDESESLVVRIVDACPCEYAPNAYSNKKWCCQDSGAGDMHTDLSVWAFEKLARKKYGNMALRYREVPCNYIPEKVARSREEEGSTPFDFPPKSARRPHEWTFVQRTDERGVAQGAVSRVEDASDVYDKDTIVPGDQVYKDGTYKLSYGKKVKFIHGDGKSNTTKNEP